MLGLIVIVLVAGEKHEPGQGLLPGSGFPLGSRKPKQRAVKSQLPGAVEQTKAAANRARCW